MASKSQRKRESRSKSPAKVKKEHRRSTPSRKRQRSETPPVEDNKEEVMDSEVPRSVSVADLFFEELVKTQENMSVTLRRIETMEDPVSGEVRVFYTEHLHDGLLDVDVAEAPQALEEAAGE